MLAAGPRIICVRYKCIFLFSMKISLDGATHICMYVRTYVRTHLLALDWTDLDWTDCNG